MKNLIKARRSDKARVVAILMHSFKQDPHIAWYVGEGKGRNRRLRVLMEFSFEKGFANEEVYLTPGKNAVAIWKNPSRDKMTPMLFWLHLKFLWIMGLSKVMSIDKLEKAIESRYPEDKNYIYLWLLGVAPEHQGKGLSSQLLRSRLKKSEQEKVPVYLETTNPANLPIYQKKGFELYDKMPLDLQKGDHIHFMKTSVEKKEADLHLV